MLSLKQAASRVGKGKSTLQRDIKAGRLSAPRDDRGRYKIDPAELARVYPDEFVLHEDAREHGDVPKRPVSSHGDSMGHPKPSHTGNNGHTGTDQSATTAEAMALVRDMMTRVETAKQEEIRRLEETIEDLRERLDSASSQNRALTQMITDQRTKPEEPKKKSFFSRLAG